jgi:hypothetical protein
MSNFLNNIIQNVAGNVSIGSRGKQEDNVEQIGDNLFIFNVFLNNGKARTGIKFSAVEEFNIIDDLRYFYVYGTLTINYNEDVLETFEGIGTSTKQVEPYIFRGDGRDIIEIDIMPQLKEQQCLEVYCSEGDRKKYNIKHICSIYKYEDFTEGGGKKKRKFYFWDRDYQLLNELNINYSSADRVKNNKSFFNFNGTSTQVSKSNTDNSMFTGDVIEDILRHSLVDLAKLKFSKGSWDKGASKICYYSPAMNKAVDDLTYVLTYHISDKTNFNLPCILKKERYTERYNLTPLNKFYKGGLNFGSILGGNTITSGPEVIEDFIIGKIDPGSNDLLTPLAGGLGDIIPTDYNVINDYTFNKIDANELQSYMTGHVVHGVDPRGFFNSSLKPGNFSSATELYDKAIVKGNASSQGKPASSNLSTNKIRESYNNVNHTYVPYALDETQTKCFGANRAMMNLFFKNTSITFRARGNTLRQTGKFFTINRTDSNISKSHDNTILGKYMITYLRHEFKSGKYENTILGTKPYSDSKPQFNQSI